VIIIRPFARRDRFEQQLPIGDERPDLPDAAGTPASKINHLTGSLATVATVIGDRSGGRFDKVRRRGSPGATLNADSRRFRIPWRQGYTLTYLKCRRPGCAAIGLRCALYARNWWGFPLPVDDSHESSRAAWDAAVASAASGSAAPGSIVWRGHQAISQALAPFMGENRNHAHLPTGGGLDFLSVGPSAEPGCLEFMVGDRVVQIMKPGSLTLERIDSAGNSFLLLELDNLDPSGVYGTDENEPDGDSDAEHADSAARNWSQLRRPSMSVGTYGTGAFWTMTRTVTRFPSPMMRGSPCAGYRARCCWWPREVYGTVILRLTTAVTTE
jgi:hypothetical protein